jgi:hypothetical protein
MATVALLLGLASCGGSDALSRPAAARLQPPVAAIRAAAASDDRTGATAAAAEVRSVVADLQKTGEISAQQASEILAAGAQVEAQLALLSDPRPETSTSTTTEPDDQRRGKGKDRSDDEREDDD